MTHVAKIATGELILHFYEEDSGWSWYSCKIARFSSLFAVRHTFMSIVLHPRGLLHTFMSIGAKGLIALGLFSFIALCSPSVPAALMFLILGFIEIKSLKKSLEIITVSHRPFSYWEICKTAQILLLSDILASVKLY